MSDDEIVAATVIHAADLDRLAAFYVAAVGLREQQRHATYIMLEANGFQLVLLPRDGSFALALNAGAALAERRSEASIKPVFVNPNIATARTAAR